MSTVRCPKCGHLWGSHRAESSWPDKPFCHTEKHSRGAAPPMCMCRERPPSPDDTTATDENRRAE